MPLVSPRIYATRPLLKQPRRRYLLQRVRRSLQRFPELNGRVITVGVTRQAEGTAASDNLTIRFDLRRRVPSYYTIGHELTHLLQIVSDVPEGEVQCDIWTLARSGLFTDEAPYYLPLPRRVQREWGRYARRVRALCRRAIRERENRRYYIRWLEAELREL